MGVVSSQNELAKLQVTRVSVSKIGEQCQVAWQGACAQAKEEMLAQATEPVSLSCQLHHFCSKAGVLSIEERCTPADNNRLTSHWFRGCTHAHTQCVTQTHTWTQMQYVTHTCTHAVCHTHTHTCTHKVCHTDTRTHVHMHCVTQTHAHMHTRSVSHRHVHTYAHSHLRGVSHTETRTLTRTVSHTEKHLSLGSASRTHTQSDA